MITEKTAFQSKFPTEQEQTPASSWHVITPTPDKKKAVFLAQKIFAELIYDTVYLENSPYTFPEVQTLLEGITVGGHTLSDQKLVLNQAESWKKLLDLVVHDRFSPSKDIACYLHKTVAREEALTWGKFRNIQMMIAGTEWQPPAADKLDDLFINMQEQINRIADPHERGIRIFLHMARNQFFSDGNKRTGRLMMNGIILSSGYEAISIPAKRRLEFNQKMVCFYDSGSMEEMIEFMLRCGHNLEYELV